MEEQSQDPVDLMLDGRFEEAAAAYITMYRAALGRNDRAFGPDLLMGLHYCVAGTMNSEPSAPEVATAVTERLRKEVALDPLVLDDLQIAISMVEKARKKAERSVAQVESAEAERWEEE